MKFRDISHGILFSIALLTGRSLYSAEYIEETYEFPFEVKNPTTKFSFIVLEAPNDIGKVDVTFKNVPFPILAIDYIADNMSEMASVKRKVHVAYNKNETIIRHRDPKKHSEYNCERDENERFKRGACLRSLRLILPPTLTVTIYQNNVCVYSRADLLEMKKRQFPHLFKDDPATARVKKQDTERKLKELNSLFKKGLITKEEYAEKKKAILDRM